MNGRTSKSVRRQVSREARKKLGSEMNLLREVFRGRPRNPWPILPLKFLGLFFLSIILPTKAWEMGLSIYVRKGEFEFSPWEDKPTTGGDLNNEV